MTKITERDNVVKKKKELKIYTVYVQARVENLYCIQESIEYARIEDYQKSKVAACTFKALEFKRRNYV